ncbi:MAG: hypothetical protein ACREGH_00145 [Minisyncoccia bacterium]
MLASSLIDSPYYLLAKDLGYFVVAALGLIVAYRGLHTWKEQIRGNVEYETARRLYKAVLKTRDTISYVRNPWIPAAESQEAQEKYPHADKATANAVYYVRWEKMKEVLSALELEQLEAEVLWGKEVIEELKPIRACVSKLNLYLTDFLRPSDQKVRKHMETHEIIYELRTEIETDAFTNEIDIAVEVVGSFLKSKYKFSSR